MAVTNISNKIYSNIVRKIESDGITLTNDEKKMILKALKKSIAEVTPGTTKATIKNHQKPLC